MEDVHGKIFGKLKIIGLDKGSIYRKWICMCDCGKTTKSTYAVLNSGKKRSCGCLRSETTRALKTIHGQATSNQTKEYKSWAHAKRRCCSKKDQDYHSYGKRGIKMCERWKNSFINFFLDMGKCPSGYSLDRINFNGDYEPRNCRWADSLTQSRNKRTSVQFFWNGEWKHLKEIADEKKVPYKYLWRKFKENGNQRRFLSDMETQGS